MEWKQIFGCAIIILLEYLARHVNLVIITSILISAWADARQQMSTDWPDEQLKTLYSNIFVTIMGEYLQKIQHFNTSYNCAITGICCYSAHNFQDLADADWRS